MSRVVTTLTIIALFWLNGCSLYRSTSVTTRGVGNQTAFDFQTRGMNGLLSLRLWRTDTKEVLWDVNLNYYRGTNLAYGELPTEFRTFNGARNRATQNFPPEGKKPSPLPRSTTFVIELASQYDTAFAPAFQTDYFVFSTDADGRLSKTKKVEHITENDLPKPKQTG